MVPSCGVDVPQARDRERRAVRRGSVSSVLPRPSHFHGGSGFRGGSGQPRLPGSSVTAGSSAVTGADAPPGVTLVKQGECCGVQDTPGAAASGRRGPGAGCGRPGGEQALPLAAVPVINRRSRRPGRAGHRFTAASMVSRRPGRRFPELPYSPLARSMCHRPIGAARGGRVCAGRAVTAARSARTRGRCAVWPVCGGYAGRWQNWRASLRAGLTARTAPSSGCAAGTIPCGPCCARAVYRRAG